MTTPYEKAQAALAQLKGAVYDLLLAQGQDGLKNVEIGRALGIYAGHEGHKGHISRTILAMMEAEGAVYQGEEYKWYLAENRNPAD